MMNFRGILLSLYSLYYLILLRNYSSISIFPCLLLSSFLIFLSTVITFDALCKGDLCSSLIVILLFFLSFPFLLFLSDFQTNCNSFCFCVIMNFISYLIGKAFYNNFYLVFIVFNHHLSH